MQRNAEGDLEWVANIGLYFCSTCTKCSSAIRAELSRSPHVHVVSPLSKRGRIKELKNVMLTLCVSMSWWAVRDLVYHATHLHEINMVLQPKVLFNKWKYEKYSVSSLVLPSAKNWFYLPVALHYCLLTVIHSFHQCPVYLALNFGHIWFTCSWSDKTDFVFTFGGRLHV